MRTRAGLVAGELLTAGRLRSFVARGLWAVGLVALGSCASARMGANPELDVAPTIVWEGIDYTGVKMVGVEAFRDPKAIFPGFLKTWNALFVEEMMVKLGRKLGRPVELEVEPMLKFNERARPSQIIEKFSIEGDNLSPQDVAQMVTRYRLDGTDGIGLVFIVDVMEKLAGRACLYPTFFDRRTRRVIESWRTCQPAGGIGFRNYWFNPIKEALGTI